jgi:predicted HicB family RNase H-like nuclease
MTMSKKTAPAGKNAATGARTTVRLPERLHRRAKLAAAWSGAKLQEFIADAVELHLARTEADMSESARYTLPAPSGRKAR